MNSKLRIPLCWKAALVRAERPAVVLVPVGSVEPHGPHLPLATDTLISEAVIARAARLLEPTFLVMAAPAVPYGVTDYARGFAGAVSIPAAALTAYLRAVVEGFALAGVRHVCLVNNHLEPEHDAAVRAAIVGLAPTRASVACPLERRFARLLSDEFKRGECHAGQYETSIVLAHAPALVDAPAARALPEVPISLSAQIAAGVTEFGAMGMARAYAGAPHRATAAEGEATIDTLAEMVATRVREALN